MKEVLHIYTRVSSEIQVNRYSLSAQADKGRLFAESLNMHYVLHEERGKSAANTDLENRPVLDNLLILVSEGKVKNIYVTELDRLSRNTESLAYIKSKLVKHKVNLYVSDKLIDFENASDYLLIQLMISIAEYENRIRVKRSKRGMAVAVAAGKWGGGIQPYGYTTDSDNYLIVDDKEKEVYKRMVKLSLMGKGSNTIAGILSEEGIPSKGKKFYKNGIRRQDKDTGELIVKESSEIIWKGNTVLRILRNPIYKGKRLYKGATISAPALISEEEWEQVQANLSRNCNNSPRNNKQHFYLLRNLVKCNRCGLTYFGLVKEKKGMHQYVCLSKRKDPHERYCGNKSINKRRLETLVWNRLMDVLTNSSIAREQMNRIFNSSEAYKKKTEEQIKKLERSIKSLREQVDRTVTVFVKGIISEEELEKQKGRIGAHIEKQEEALQKKRSELALFSAQNSVYSWMLKVEDEMKNLRNNATDVQKREIVERFINRVLVEYIDEHKEHVVQIELKYPLFENKENSQTLTLGGTILSDDPNMEILNYINKNELEAEEEHKNNNAEMDISEEPSKLIFSQKADKMNENEDFSVPPIAQPQHQRLYGEDF